MMLNLLQPKNLLSSCSRGTNINDHHHVITGNVGLSGSSRVDAVTEVGMSDNLYDNYIVGRKLGRGATGKVYRVMCKRNQGYFACKVMHKPKLKIEKIRREIQILSVLQHKNIVSLHECYENQRDIFMVMELAKGGELFTALRESGAFPEQKVRVIISQLLSAIQYLHGNLIVHRDIKLENILLNDYSESDSSKQVLVADFGLAKRLESTSARTFTVCGSQHYVAPEVLVNLGYGFSPDLWSLGVLTFMLLTDTPPFYESEEGTVFEAIMAGNYMIPYEFNNCMSVAAKDFIHQLLLLNPANRMSAVDCSKHPFILKTQSQ